MMAHRTGLIAATLLLLASAAFANDGRTYFTDERIATGKENAAKYEWARAVRKRMLETGDGISYYTGRGKYTSTLEFVTQSDEFMWVLMPPTTISRVVFPNEAKALCPVCGEKVKSISVWNPFSIDPVNHPFKVHCPMCKKWWPTNEYVEGDMTSGDLPDNGDGGIYKGPGPMNGKKFFFLRDYAHMCYGSVVIPTLKSLSEAYSLTGNRLYAHKGSILLARLAMEYPNYGWEGTSFEDKGLENRFDRTYLGPWKNRHPHYTWKKGGMVTDLIWETFSLEPTAYAYDAFYDYLDTDPELIAFLKRKGMPIENGADLRQYIETYIFRAAMRSLQLGWIKGNEGFHQAAALAVALVMDDYGDTHPNSQDMVDYAYHGLGHSAYILVNGLHRDGGGHESPSYNRIKLDFIRVARLMEEVRKRHPERFPSGTYPDLFANPKARALFDYNMDMFINDRWWPSIGDTGGIGKPSRRKDIVYSSLKEENLYAVQRFGDPRHARACTNTQGEFATGELWEPYPETQIRELLARPESQIDRRSRALDGYGMAILESGQQPRKHAVLLNYASLRGHRQSDDLTLGLFARGNRFLPDLGYPKTWEFRAQWDACSLTHNTVAVDETNHYPGIGGMGRLFASVGGVHVITASHDPYPAPAKLGRKDAPRTDLFERTAIMVDVDNDRYYVVDLFAVNGGEQHDQSWHGMLVQPEAPALDWKLQDKGTLAGPDVQRFGAYTDRWGREHKKGAFSSFVNQVRRATLTAPARWAWKSGLPEGDTLHLHIVPLNGPAEVIMCEGRSPVWKGPSLPFVIVRRQAENGAPSHFLTVLDGWQKAPVVSSVEARGGRPGSGQPLAITVQRPDGYDEITLNLPDGPSLTKALRPLGVRVRSNTNGQWTRDVRIGQWQPGKTDGYRTAVIQSLDYEAQTVTLSMDRAGDADFAPGRTVRIYNDRRSGLYRIMKAARAGDALTLTLDCTALLARGPVRKAAAGQVVLDAHLTFATSKPDHKTQSAFAGAWLGQGADALRLKGAHRNGTLYLEKPQSAKALTDRFGGKVASAWEYGVGDSIEIARVNE